MGNYWGITRVGCQLKLQILVIGPSERNWKDYKHVQRGQRSRLLSDSSEKQAIIYGTAKMHKNSIMGTRCVYNWNNIMIDMGLENIVHHDRYPHHDKILNAWIKDWDSDIPRTRDQDN